MLGAGRLPQRLFAWCNRKPSKRARETVRLKAEIRAVHKEVYGTYGSPRVHPELKAREFRVGRYRVARLMREEGLSARFKRPFRRTTDSNHDGPVAKNRLDRQFDVDAPNRVWATDITYLRTQQGSLYLAVVLDLFSRRVVGWSMAEHLRTELVLGALEEALGQRALEGALLHHSDRGCQDASSAYRDALSDAEIECSMSRKGDCWDNAVVESVFGSLKTELAHRQTWSTRLAARTAVFEYIEVFYNRQRRHSYLGYVSPAEYEQRYALGPVEFSMPGTESRRRSPLAARRSPLRSKNLLSPQPRRKKTSSIAAWLKTRSPWREALRYEEMSALDDFVGAGERLRGPIRWDRGNKPTVHRVTAVPPPPAIRRRPPRPPFPERQDPLDASVEGSR